MKRVTVAICNSASFQFILPYEQKRQTFQTNSVSIRIIKYFAISKVTTRVRMLSVGTDTAPQSFYGTIVYCLAVDNALFEAG